MVRLAWHEAGTFCHYCSKRGGPHGLMRFPGAIKDPSNNGISTIAPPLQDVWSQEGFDETITLADFWQFAGVVAIEWMKGPHIPYRPGREDWSESDITPWDRLPSADFGFPEWDPTSHFMRDIFYRMGFDDYEIVVLLGAHTLGECHAQWSGFFGLWTPDPLVFNNAFYHELIYHKWALTPNTHQYFDTTPGLEFLMMLHSDMALIHDPNFLRHVQRFADDQEAWFKAFAEVFPKLQELGVHSLLPPIDW